MSLNHTPLAVQAEVARLAGVIGSTNDLAVYITAKRDLEHLANCEGKNHRVDAENEIRGTIRHLSATHGKRITAQRDAACPYSRKNYYSPSNTSTKAA